MNADHHHVCPGHEARGESAAAASLPFSPLGWSAWQRLAVAAAAVAALWAVVWWALD